MLPFPDARRLLASTLGTHARVRPAGLLYHTSLSARPISWGSKCAVPLVRPQARKVPFLDNSGRWTPDGSWRQHLGHVHAFTKASSTTHYSRLGAISCKSNCAGPLVRPQARKVPFLDNSDQKQK